MPRFAALILAGGQASRMGGGDKPLRALGGRPMLARLVETLAPAAAAIAISANGDPARFTGFGLPVLADAAAFAGQGPLAGVLAGLDWAAASGATLLLTAPGDTPFLPAGLAAALMPAPAYAACDGRDHPLAALWPVDCRAALRMWLTEGRSGSVLRFAERIGSRPVVFPPGDRDWFFNVNTQDDLATAQDMLTRF